MHERCLRPIWLAYAQAGEDGVQLTSRIAAAGLAALLLFTPAAQVYAQMLPLQQLQENNRCGSLGSVSVVHVRYASILCACKLEILKLSSLSTHLIHSNSDAALPASISADHEHQFKASSPTTMEHAASISAFMWQMCAKATLYEIKHDAFSTDGTVAPCSAHIHSHRCTPTLTYSQASSCC